MSARTLLVTGGAGGIGGRLVEALRVEWEVVVVDVTSPTVALPGVSYHTADLADQSQVDALAATLQAEHGSLGAIVHCAGIARYGAFLDMPRSEWELVIRVNLLGTLSVMQALAPLLTDEGRVVLFSSGTVFKGPGAAAAYAASKGGVLAFGRCLAEELGPRGITVNMIAPGHVRTAMVEAVAHTEEANIATRVIKRGSTPDDLVEPVQFFLSPGASFVTGQTLVVDGGSIRH